MDAYGEEEGDPTCTGPLMRVVLHLKAEELFSVLPALQKLYHRQETPLDPMFFSTLTNVPPELTNNFDEDLAARQALKSVADGNPVERRQVKSPLLRLDTFSIPSTNPRAPSAAAIFYRRRSTQAR